MDEVLSCEALILSEKEIKDFWALLHKSGDKI